MVNLTTPSDQDKTKGIRMDSSRVRKSIFGDEMSDRLTSVWEKPFIVPVLFIIIFALGVFVRVWQFDRVPPGINVDEASVGLEAYSLYHFGVDRNGQSWPVYFVSWGSGMDALEAYILLPFMSLGLSSFSVRLPILLSGILTLLLVFLIGRRILGTKFALIFMFLLAISPWHIILSRWGHDENIVPFIFALGFLSLLRSEKENYWFVIAVLFFGLSLYAYIANFVAVPVFLLCAVPVLLASARVKVRTVLIGLAVLVIMAVPLVLFVFVNAWGLQTIRLGPFTVPRLPLDARFLVMTASSDHNAFLTLIKNIWAEARLLMISQTDGNIWNVVDPFGYLYVFSFPFAIVGVYLLVKPEKPKKSPEKYLMLAWLVAALCIGVFQRANINRIGLVFIPIIFCCAVFLDWLGGRSRAALGILIAVFLFSFTVFNATYHGSEYQAQAGEPFAVGLMPALQYASQEATGPICVTGNNRAPYIYVLFNNPQPPSTYLNSIEYVYPNSISRNVVSLKRYTFGLDNCSPDPATVYVLYYEQPPSTDGVSFTEKAFGEYHVFSPNR
jgi:hypothetical protein